MELCVCVCVSQSYLRRDVSVISELHELDLQINDLRLEPEMSHDQLETDSRPSSGRASENRQDFHIGMSDIINLQLFLANIGL